MRGHRCRNRNLFHHGGQGDEAPGQEEKERKDSECLGYGQRCRYHRGARDHDGGRGDWPLCDDDLDIGGGCALRMEDRLSVTTVYASDSR